MYLKNLKRGEFKLRGTETGFYKVYEMKDFVSKIEERIEQFEANEEFDKVMVDATIKILNAAPLVHNSDMRRSTSFLRRNQAIALLGQEQLDQCSEYIKMKLFMESMKKHLYGCDELYINMIAVSTSRNYAAVLCKEYESDEEFDIYDLNTSLELFYAELVDDSKKADYIYPLSFNDDYDFANEAEYIF